MATTTTAQQRKRQTRTKRVSALPAIRMSQLSPAHIDLRDPLKAVLICADCMTWVPITGIKGGIKDAVYKLVPHHRGKAGEAPGLRCRSSNRRVTWDVTIPEWYAALKEVSRQSASRRATAVLPKPFSPRTNQELDSRAARGADRRRAEWARVQQDVADTDAARRIIPAHARPTEGPVLSM